MNPDPAAPPAAFTPGMAPTLRAALASSRRSEGALHPDAEVDRWIEERRRAARLEARVVPLADLDRWRTHPDSGFLEHDSGRFFSILGVAVRHQLRGRQVTWDQPLIEQPEVGLLGLLVRPIDGLLHLCLQAKEEPGNLGLVQLSPTVQATQSNYTLVHRGKAPLFCELFLEAPRERILFSALQPEDGGRFLRKSNLNMVVCADEGTPLDLPEAFLWVTLRQVARLAGRDNLLNSCLRSLLACLL